MSHLTEQSIRDHGTGRSRIPGPMRQSALALFMFVLPAVWTLPPSIANADSIPCDCQTCHGDFHGPNWAGCSACHDSPPATGSHLVHYDSEPLLNLRYGDTTVSSTADAYKFGCGNCHPLSNTNHRNGTVEVELYDPLSPAGSLKALNPANASYDQGTKTCTNVYCHSGPGVIPSDIVGDPLLYPANPVPPGYTLNGPDRRNNYYIMDASCSSLAYPPYTVDHARVYATTPPWGTTETFTMCTECHALPPTTSYPVVSAGEGDSHQWIDDFGYRNLHTWNMGFEPVPCRTCHYDTVMEVGTYYLTTSNLEGEIAYNPLPLASRVPHVNGSPDVVFDAVNGFTYRNTYDLSGAAYDPGAKTCANVACHSNAGPVGSPRWQQAPKWGSPYRWWNSAECDLCHRMGVLNETCQQPTP